MRECKFMNRPEISVVIPFYKEGALISEAIESVLMQTYQNFEIILVDNNSDSLTLNTAENYVKRYPERIKLFHETKQGITFSKNTGVINSKAPYIAFLDGDDLMKPDRLHKQYEILKNNDEIILVASNYDLLSYDSKSIIAKDISSPASEVQSFDRLIKIYLDLFVNTFSPAYLNTFGLFLPSTWLFRKDVFIASGLFNTKLNNGWDDYELLMRLFRFGEFFKISESLCFYRCESDTTRKLKNKSYSKYKRFLSVQIYVASLWDQFGFNSKNIKPLKKICSIWLQVFGIALIGYENGLKYGRQLLFKSILIDPYNFFAWKLYIKSFFPRFLHPKIFWFHEFNKEPLNEINTNIVSSFLSLPIKYDL